MLLIQIEGERMKSCFLFGHADAPQSILPDLIEAIENEVSKGTTVFYVGYHGDFDRMAAAALREIKKKHREVTAILVLSYHPSEQPIEPPYGFDGTFYPPLENTPRRYAIVRANQYMITGSSSLICYVRHFGNSRKLLECAERQKDISIVNLSDTM